MIATLESTGMRKVSVDDLEPGGFERNVDRRCLSDPLATTDVAINRYRVEPGRRISGLHAHVDQEEVFVVVAGEATFETLSGEIAVGTGEAIRFAPGEFQSAKNASDGELTVFALGAPRDSGDVRVPLACPECGHDDRRPSVAADGETPALVCPDCGAESEAECPDCGGNDMRVILSADGKTPVEVCRDCGREPVT